MPGNNQPTRPDRNTSSAQPPPGDSLIRSQGQTRYAETADAESPSGQEPSQAAAAFLHGVRARRDEAHFVVREGNSIRNVALDAEEMSVGRSTKCYVRLNDSAASTVHAAIYRRGGEYVLLDHDSRNGVYVNGIKVLEHRLVPGDTVRIGGTTLRFLRSLGNEPRELIGSDQRRPVVLIPGFSGSELWKGDQRVWPNKLRLLLSTQRQMERDWSDLRVGSLVRKKALVPGFTSSDSFATLVDFLTQELGYQHGRDLLEFAYDWRQDNRHTAQLLATEIERWRAGRTNPTEPFVLLAHSMGGIVARLYLRLFGGTDGVERCVFLGTPHLGSIRALRMALGGGVLPFGIAAEKLRRLLLGFPAMYQLLPAYPAATIAQGGEFFPFDTEPDWLPPEHRSHFDRALAVRQILDAQAEDEAIPSTCIFGYGKRMPQQLTLKRVRGSFRVVRELRFRSGDGAVPQFSAVLDTAEVHPVVQWHSALHSDRNVMRHLRFELLERPRIPLGA